MSNNDTSYRKDIEALCKHAMDTMINLSTLAENPSCDSSSCKEGFIIADRVEKVNEENKISKLYLSLFDIW